MLSVIKTFYKIDQHGRRQWRRQKLSSWRSGSDQFSWFHWRKWPLFCAVCFNKWWLIRGDCAIDTTGQWLNSSGSVCCVVVVVRSVTVRCNILTDLMTREMEKYSDGQWNGKSDMQSVCWVVSGGSLQTVLFVWMAGWLWQSVNARAMEDSLKMRHANLQTLNFVVLPLYVAAALTTALKLLKSAATAAEAAQLVVCTGWEFESASPSRRFPLAVQPQLLHSTNLTVQGQAEGSDCRLEANSAVIPVSPISAVIVPRGFMLHWSA